MGFELVGLHWTPERFEEYLNNSFSQSGLDWAKRVTVHHTAHPNLAQRPNGWTVQHMKNLASYYGKELAWSAGPHLFTDDDEVYGLSSLWRRGVHARSFNSDSIGIECLGNYDVEDPTTGRGYNCMNTTAKVVASILKVKGLTANSETIKFHREDPKSSKTCPGKLVDRSWFVGLVKSHMSSPANEVYPSKELNLEQRIERLEKRLNIT